MRLRNVCEGLNGGNFYCYDPAYVTQICKLHPIQLVKTVRLRAHHAESLLKEEGLNIKIIALFRDPRAVRSSRLGRSWCNFDSCINLSTVCRNQDQDMQVARRLSDLHPDKVIIAKYEELAKRPKLAIPRILKVCSTSTLLWSCSDPNFDISSLYKSLSVGNLEGEPTYIRLCVLFSLLLC